MLGASFLGVKAQRDSLTATSYHMEVLALPEASLRAGCFDSQVCWLDAQVQPQIFGAGYICDDNRRNEAARLDVNRVL